MGHFPFSSFSEDFPLDGNRKENAVYIEENAKNAHFIG